MTKIEYCWKHWIFKSNFENFHVVLRFETIEFVSKYLKLRYWFWLILIWKNKTKMNCVKNLRMLLKNCNSYFEKIFVISIISNIVQIFSHYEYLVFCDSRIVFFARSFEISIILFYNLQIKKNSCNVCRDMYRKLSRTYVYVWNVNLIIVRKNDNWKFDSICLMRFVIKNFKFFILSIQILYSFN